MKKRLAKLIVKTGVFMHNYGYKLISKGAIILNNGIHPKHRIMNYHQFFINNIFKEDIVLDIGCGIGAIAFDVAKKAKKIVGIDIQKKNLEFAQKRYKKENLTFVLGDATKYVFTTKFDVLILSNVLEHIENRGDFLKSLKKIAPKFLIRVPLITRGWLPMYLKEKGYKYRLDNTHFIEYTEEGLKKEIERAGLKIKSFYVRWGELYAVAVRR